MKHNENLIIECQNYENHEIRIIQRQKKNKKSLNLIIQCQNHENNEILKFHARITKIMKI